MLPRLLAFGFLCNPFYTKESKSVDFFGSITLVCASFGETVLYSSSDVLNNFFKELFNGTVRLKNDKILKKKKLLLTKYEHVADVVVKFYSCATYVKGV